MDTEKILSELIEQYHCSAKEIKQIKQHLEEISSITNAKALEKEELSKIKELKPIILKHRKIIEKWFASEDKKSE